MTPNLRRLGTTLAIVALLAATAMPVFASHNTSHNDTGGNHDHTGGNHDHTGGSHDHNDTGGSHDHTGGNHDHTPGNHKHRPGNHKHRPGNHDHTPWNKHHHHHSHCNNDYPARNRYIPGWSVRSICGRRVPSDCWVGRRNYRLLTFHVCRIDDSYIG